jgi:hypothetical protein
MSLDLATPESILSPADNGVQGATIWYFLATKTDTKGVFDETQ